MAAITTMSLSSVKVGGRAFAPTRSARSSSVRSVTVMAADRPVWYPGNEPAKHLDGSLPGDFGFDPLSLGSDPELLKWFVQAELQNGRWAMLGSTGVLVTDAARVAGADLPVWYEAGKATSYENAFVHPTPTDFMTLAITQALLMGWAEGRRWMDMRNPGSCNEDPIFNYSLPDGADVGYPGGRWFNPAAMAGEDKMLMRTREIKNARLAMLACLGFAVQAFVTGEGPVENLVHHLADPYNVNIAM